MKIRINVSSWDVLLAIEQAADRFLKEIYDRTRCLLGSVSSAASSCNVTTLYSQQVRANEQRKKERAKEKRPFFFASITLDDPSTHNSQLPDQAQCNKRQTHDQPTTSHTIRLSYHPFLSLHPVCMVSPSPFLSSVFFIVSVSTTSV